MATARTLGYGLLLLCLGSVSCEALGRIIDRGNLGAATSEIAGPGETVFNVLDYGAKLGGKEDSTMPFVRAWLAACHFNGDKKRLVIPQGEFLIDTIGFQGPCNGTSPIVVQIIGTIKRTQSSEFPSLRDYWFAFEYIDGLVVTGGGTFKGQGEEYSPNMDFCNKDDPNCSMSSSILFDNVTNAIIRDITSVNSKGFHFQLFGCGNFRAKRLRIIAPRDIPNTDGIHISHSTNVKISKSVISTGDDCITIGSGSTNILINKITCGPGRGGIRVGSLGTYLEKNDVRGISVKNCTLSNTENGLRITAFPDLPPSLFSGLLFQNIIMNSVKNPITIDQDTCPKSKCGGKSPSPVKIRDVHFQNIKGTSTSEVAVKIMCNSQVPCQNVQLFNIDLKYANASVKTVASTTSICLNANVGYTGLQNPPPCRN